MLIWFGLIATLCLAFHPGIALTSVSFLPTSLTASHTPFSHPPLLVWLWQMLDHLGSGQHILYVILWCLYGIAGWLLITATHRSFWLRLLFAAMLLSPMPVTLLRYHWPDALLLVLLAWLCMSLARLALTRHTVWAGLALLAITAAATLFPISALPLLPLVWLVFYLLPRQRNSLILAFNSCAMIAVITWVLSMVPASGGYPASIWPVSHSLLPAAAQTGWLEAAWHLPVTAAPLPDGAATWAQPVLEWLAYIPALSGGLHAILVAAIMLLALLTQRQSPFFVVILALGSSAMLSLGQLLVLYDNAALRFMLWPVWVSIVSIGLLRWPERKTQSLRRFKRASTHKARS